MKLCVDCKHFIFDQASLCGHTSLITIEPVYGSETYHKASWTRSREDLCGLEAKLFEPEPPKVSLWKRIFG